MHFLLLIALYISINIYGWVGGTIEKSALDAIFMVTYTTHSSPSAL